MAVSLEKFISTPGPFTDPDWTGGQETLDFLGASKVLVIGAGGLGCEILKNLAHSGFKDIHVIDMDTIDVSNLNRQFLFRAEDVGSSKADVAAKFVMSRVEGVTITPHFCAIQDKDEAFYKSFTIVICGLDSIEARRWMNSTLVGLVDESDPQSLKPLIDGGTEGFKGQARVVFPTVNSCLECQLSMHAPRAAVPLCTLATVPRQPEHCIEWARLIAWEEERKDDLLDTDNPEHITWLYRKAEARAQEFGISGVTYSRTQGVVKNIIPAIASTNAIIAASCCAEALKIITNCNPFLNTYMMYAGDSENGLYTHTFEAEKKEDCPVCGNRAIPISVNSDWTLQEFIEHLATLPEAQVKKPSLRTEEKSLFYQAPPQLRETTLPNLEKKLKELIVSGQELAVSDPAYPFTLRFKANFK